MTDLPSKDYSTTRWLAVSQTLLALYLIFFSAAFGKSPAEIVVLGLVFSTLSTTIVVVFRRVFINRFEFLIHLVIGADIFLEGLIPYHETLDFFFCAFAFWFVFIGYHTFLVRSQNRKSAKTSRLNLNSTSVH